MPNCSAIAPHNVSGNWDFFNARHMQASARVGLLTCPTSFFHCIGPSKCSQKPEITDFDDLGFTRGSIPDGYQLRYPINFAMLVDQLMVQPLTYLVTSLDQRRGRKLWTQLDYSEA